MNPVKPTCPVPLFDKLVDEHPHDHEEAFPFRTYTLEQLKESIRREVSLILNHRQNLSLILENGEQTEALLGSVLFFGATDFSLLNYRRDTAWKMRVEDEIVQALQRFEPRLKSVQADVQEFNEQTRILSVILWADISINQVREQITFPVQIKGFGQNIQDSQIEKAS